MASCNEVLPWIKAGWIGAEIGVAGGESAQAFLEHGVRFLYLIDPWAPYDGLLETFPDTDYKTAMDRLSPYASRHAHLRMKSEDAAQYIPPILDFVWIDANHRYEYVKRDLELYWPKIKIGGIMCGHDYTDNADTCQVMTAVNEFVKEHGINGMSLPLPSWVIGKR